jgi:hypothetical protein
MAKYMFFFESGASIIHKVYLFSPVRTRGSAGGSDLNLRFKSLFLPDYFFSSKNSEIMLPSGMPANGILSFLVLEQNFGLFLPDGKEWWRVKPRPDPQAWFSYLSNIFTSLAVPSRV